MKQQRLYVQDILERIRLIEDFTQDGLDTFLDSVLIQEGVIRCFEVIGEVVKRLSPELTAAHPGIPWRQISGFRDVLIHDYDEIDVEVVWRIVAEDLVPLKQAVEAMLAQIEADESHS
jgi:uncharacterized protein with HEPN domain